ncbi:MBL fold metallo-hydrolase [Saccharothrix violaceirubra]|uniref:Cyclase n=1 Tax=Saccharothrix violaceirubra TaxID=413306 RepID=A0A7W7T477_9PSEU|nr:MBL fold metallo-hydrolase [Saccharothrix violaceirubra]MBB4966232.1 cyclase [Saccharothrix violaceirubra]
MTSEPVLAEIAPGVHAWVQPDGTWWLNNAGAVHAGDEVVLVDTCATRARTLAFLDAVDAATGGAPIGFAANTHLHGDHVHGNALLPDTTTIVAHELTRRGILADTILKNTPPAWSPTPDWDIDELRAPTLTFRDEVTVHAGDTPIVLRHPGFPAHTVGDVVAWLPDQRVLFTGDLVFHGVTPLIAMGSVTGAAKSVDWLRTFDPETVVPGHGPVIDRNAWEEVLETHTRYYTFVRTVADHGLTHDLTPLEAARQADLGEFAALPDAERLVANLHRAYAELDGREFDITAALGDAVAYHGGPLRCAL